MWLGPRSPRSTRSARCCHWSRTSTIFVVKNFINDTSFFEWNPEVYKSYFNMLKNAVEVNVPRLNEMAYEQVELAGVPFSTFVADRNSQGLPGNYSMVLRG